MYFYSVTILSEDTQWRRTYLLSAKKKKERSKFEKHSGMGYKAAMEIPKSASLREPKPELNDTNYTHKHPLVRKWNAPTPDIDGELSTHAKRSAS